MDPCVDPVSIRFGEDLQRLLVLSRNNFGNGLEAVFLVAWIYPLRRVTECKILATAQARCLLQYRRALFLDGAWIHRRFKDDNIAAFKKPAHGFRSVENGGEVGPVQRIDRRWYGNNE